MSVLTDNTCAALLFAGNRIDPPEYCDEYPEPGSEYCEAHAHAGDEYEPDEPEPWDDGDQYTGPTFMEFDE